MQDWKLQKNYFRNFYAKAHNDEASMNKLISRTLNSMIAMHNTDKY